MHFYKADELHLNIRNAYIETPVYLAQFYNRHTYLEIVVAARRRDSF